jgi:virulence factor Mce-like protein
VSPRRTGPALTASPVLVGAVTVLVTIVAVFLSYNANSGLPFVPTYDLKANVPNAAQLVKGFEVRIGGARVGIIDKIEPKQREDGSTYAQLSLKLDKEIEPLPADSTMTVRPRSSLGLKYLEIQPGSGQAGFKPGAVIPVTQAKPIVELDDFLNMFDAKARVGARLQLQGLGNGFAGRGQDVNTAIQALHPLLDDLEPVARNLSAPETRLDRFFRALADTVGEVAPVAEQQASLFVNLDITFTSLASIARPFLQETIRESPPSELVAIEDFPKQRPFIRNNTAFFRELAPGVATLPTSAPIVADAFEAGTEVLPKTPPVNEDLGDVFKALADFSEDPNVRLGVQQLTRLSSSLKPTLKFLTPAQTTCNYATLWFRNAASLLSEGDTNGNWQRFVVVAAPQDPRTLALGPNNESGPSNAPANGPGDYNHLHFNPYPNSAAPGQPKECEAGNEIYQSGRTIVGNPPGPKITKTDGQKGINAQPSGATP